MCTCTAPCIFQSSQGTQVTPPLCSSEPYRTDSPRESIRLPISQRTSTRWSHSLDLHTFPSALRVIHQFVLSLSLYPFSLSRFSLEHTSLYIAIHAGQALLWKKWFIFPTAFMCGIGEIIGWAARTWSAKNVWNDTPFTMQISCTIISSVQLHFHFFPFLLLHHPVPSPFPFHSGRSAAARYSLTHNLRMVYFITDLLSSALPTL